MAEEGFKELIKQTKETNDLLRKQMIAEGKPDPVKFVKEEFFEILQAQIHHKEMLKAQNKTSKEIHDTEVIDQDYQAKQLVQQKGSASYLKTIAKSLQSQEEIQAMYAPKMLQLTDQRIKLSLSTLTVQNQMNKTFAGLGLFKDLKLILNKTAKNFTLENISKGIGRFFTRHDPGRGGAGAETEQKQGIFQKKFLGALNGIKKATEGTFKQVFANAKERLKAGAKGIFGFLRKFGLGVLALALIALLNDPNFPKIAKRITKVIIPAIAKFYDKVLVPIGKKLKKAFFDLMEVLEGKKGLLEFILDNKLALATATALIAPKLTFGIIEIGAGLLGKGIKAAWGAKAVQAFMETSQFKTIFGVGAILTGLAIATKDGFDGIAKSKEWKVDNVSAFIGGFLGGATTGIKNFFANAGKFALIGAGVGSFFFPPFGTLIGGAIGALLGGILALVGGENIAKTASKIFKSIKDFFGRVMQRFKDGFISGLVGIGFLKDATPQQKLEREARQAGLSVAELQRKRQADLEAEKFNAELNRRRNEISELQRSGRRVYGQSDAEKAAIGERVLQLQKELDEFKRKGVQAAANIDARSAVTTDMSSSYSIGHYPLDHPSPVIDKLGAVGYGG